MEKKKRKDPRNSILANFEFRLDDEPERTFPGITTNVSPEGFGFLTETALKEGQIMTITGHILPDMKGRHARVIWAKKGRRYVEAGAEFEADTGD